MLSHPIHTPATPGWAEGNGSEAAFRDGLNHVVLAPLVVEGLVVAVVTFGMCGDRPLWTPDEQATLGEIAALAGIAVGHGLTYQHTRTSALILQRSLLSDPPHVAGLETYARYQPAGDDEVGGDWYDMFHRRPGQLALVIGDVVGHDITAAAAMGQLRATLRGLALDRDDGPAAILQRLTTINTRLDITRFTTLIHAHLTRQGSTHEPTAPWVLRWANAGHPPPLLLAPGSAPRLLRRPHGAALIQQPTPAQTDGQITLPPGSTLLLYTDGLVERHGTDLEDNLADFTDRAEATAHEPLGQLCTQLLRDAPTTDDVALLAIRVCG
jgi:serine phosphatase RsbU (regulator of sigma subunit)